jgi:hypothetical protein
MVIEKINTDRVQKVLERVFEMSTDLRVLQEDIQTIDKSIKDVNFDYVAGKISGQMYKSSKDQLVKKRRAMIDRLNKMVGSILVVSKSIPEILKSSKL